MAENDNDKTTTYGDSEKNKTETYVNSENLKTGIYNSNPETSAYSDLQKKEFKSRTHGIGVGDKITLRDNEFLITGIISEGTGEAVIYKVEDENKSVFALKLYFEFSNSKEEPNYETLKRIKEITDPDILKLHDFGVGSDKYQGKYCFEICDFAEGGDLFSVKDFKGKFTYEFIEKYIVKEIFSGIKKLHDYKIYHCDLKPTNIFFKDINQTDLLIGDYGSAKAIDLETEKDIRKTSTVKGTSTFLPPEQARGVISEKNDYYSFGFILLNLLYPESISSDGDHRQVEKEKFEKIIERQYNLIPIIDYNPEYKRLNNLIEGLTLINHNNRFGRMEVEKWLNGEEVEVKYKATETIAVQTVKLGYATIKTEKDFIKVLETQPNWYEDLIEDQDTFSTVKIWMDSYRDIQSRKVFDSMIKFYQPLGKEYVKESLLRYFDPEREIRIDMNSFNFFTSNNIKKDVEAYISKLDEIWKFTYLDDIDKSKKIDPKKTIRFYLFQLDFSLRQLKKAVSKETEIVVGSLIDKVQSVFGLIQKPFDDYKTEIQTKVNSKDEAGTFRLLINLFYAFNPDRTFRDSKNNSIKTIDELGIFYVQNESAFADKYLKIEKERFLQKFSKTELNSLDYKQFIFEVFKDKAEAQVELVNLTFNKHRDYKVNYKFYKSLNTFLSQKNISTDFTSRSDQNELYENRRRFFQSFKSECENFVSTVTDKHNITTLTDENISTIRKKFRRDSLKRYLYIYSGQFLALLIAIPLAIIIYELATHQLRIDNNWRFQWGAVSNQSEITAPTVTHNFYKTNTDANIRSSASEYSSVVGKAYNGQEVEVLETGNSKWYKVNMNGTIGFISSKLLSYSRSSNSPSTYNSTPSNNNSNLSTSINSSQPTTINNDNSSNNNSSQNSRITETPSEPVKQYKWITCSDCRGNGKIQSNGTCPTCNGAGEYTCTQCYGNGKYVCTSCLGDKKFLCSNCKGEKYFVCSSCNGAKYFTCTACDGTGSLYDNNGRHHCYTCGGSGRIPCYTCSQTGRTPCYTCRQTGYTACYTCRQTGYLTCYKCGQTGKLKCNTCYGKGQVSGNITCPKCSGKGQVQVEI
jgi:serine/threonine protein kinase/uncharacterized protein YgiM (DUF1202 family)